MDEGDGGWWNSEMWEWFDDDENDALWNGELPMDDVLKLLQEEIEGRLVEKDRADAAEARVAELEKSLIEHTRQIANTYALHSNLLDQHVQQARELYALQVRNAELQDECQTYRDERVERKKKIYAEVREAIKMEREAR